MAARRVWSWEEAPSSGVPWLERHETVWNASHRQNSGKQQASNGWQIMAMEDASCSLGRPPKTRRDCR